MPTRAGRKSDFASERTIVHTKQVPGQGPSPAPCRSGKIWRWPKSEGLRLRFRTRRKEWRWRGLKSRLWKGVRNEAEKNWKPGTDQAMRLGMENSLGSLLSKSLKGQKTELLPGSSVTSEWRHEQPTVALCRRKNRTLVSADLQVCQPSCPRRDKAFWTLFGHV